MTVESTIADLERRIDTELRLVSGTILQTLVLGTPVGNPTIWQQPNSAPKGYVGGHARGAWQVSIGSPIAEDTPDEQIDNSGRQTIQSGQATLQGQPLGSGGSIVWVVNNAPYIGRLNDGHSLQVTPGWIDASIATAVASRRGARA